MNLEVNTRVIKRLNKVAVISSGYDEMEVISTMDTSDKEHNSIDKIEKFIQRKYANSAAHNPFSSPTFEFPPGHRIRICNFVKEVRESCGSDQVRSDKNVHTGKRRKPESNPSSNPEYNVPSENKRQKLHVEDSEEEVDVQESKVLTVMGVSKQVRSSLRKWMAKQKNDQLGQLHEGEHYSLQIIPKGTPGVFLISIKCLACGTSVMLHQAKSSVMVSNWYRHAKLCFKKQAGRAGRYQKNQDGTVLFYNTSV